MSRGGDREGAGRGTTGKGAGRGRAGQGAKQGQKEQSRGRVDSQEGRGRLSSGFGRNLGRASDIGCGLADLGSKRSAEFSQSTKLCELRVFVLASCAASNAVRRPVSLLNVGCRTRLTYGGRSWRRMDRAPCPTDRCRPVYMCVCVLSGRLAVCLTVWCVCLRCRLRAVDQAADLLTQYEQQEKMERHGHRRRSPRPGSVSSSWSAPGECRPVSQSDRLSGSVCQWCRLADQYSPDRSVGGRGPVGRSAGRTGAPA